MSCDLTTGIIVGCRDSSGGIKEIYVGNYNATGTVTQNATGMVTAITAVDTWFKYEPRKKTSSWTDSMQADEQAGTVFYEQGVNLILTKMEQAKRNEIIVLAQAKMLVIVKDQNDKYWLLGMDNGVNLGTGEAGSGTDYGDRNGYELNFEGFESEPAPEVDWTGAALTVSTTTLEG